MNTSNGVSERGPSGFLPPHLADTMSVSSISNPYDDDRTVMASHSNQRPITFTAYDSTGQAHIRQRVPPSTTQSTYQAGSASSSSPSITRAPLNTDNSKWAKPVSYRDHYSLIVANTLTPRSALETLTQDLVQYNLPQFNLLQIVLPVQLAISSKAATRVATMRCRFMVVHGSSWLWKLRLGSSINESN
jgi:hypothetical protein